MKHKRVWVMSGLSVLLAAFLAGELLGGNEKIEFSLPDIFGRQVRAQDYKGVPLFLEFGACW